MTRRAPFWARVAARAVATTTAVAVSLYLLGHAPQLVAGVLITLVVIVALTPRGRRSGGARLERVPASQWRPSRNPVSTRPEPVEAD